MKAPEQRQAVAYGVSRGAAAQRHLQPRQAWQNRCAKSLPPLKGLIPILPVNPRLAPWPNLCRLSEAFPAKHDCQFLIERRLASRPILETRSPT